MFLFHINILLRGYDWDSMCDYFLQSVFFTWVAIITTIFLIWEEITVSTLCMISTSISIIYFLYIISPIIFWMCCFYLAVSSSSIPLSPATSSSSSTSSTSSSSTTYSSLICWSMGLSVHWHRWLILLKLDSCFHRKR